MRLVRLILVVITLGVLGGCALYKVDVAQGNLITAEMKQNLKLGMTQRQVRFLLGSPMVQDAFHPERWDYVYLLRKGNGDTTEDRLRLTFSGDLLTQIAPPLPASPTVPN